MNATATKTASIKIEDIKLGRRYVEVRPGSNGAWNYTVKSVRHYLTDTLVLRNGEWTAVEMVEVTYRSGMTLVEEIGTEIAIFTDVAGE